MKKIFLCLLAVFFLALFLTGCVRSDSRPQKIWQEVKATDLFDRQQLSKNEYMTAGLSICVFQISTDKLTEIQEAIAQTDAMSVKYGNINAFSANGLISCAGDWESWQKIDRLLSLSEPVVRKRINVLITENMDEDVAIWDSLRPDAILYHTNSSATAGVGLDAGRISLRLRATPLIGLRQICSIQVTPVYKTGIEQNKKKTAKKDNYEFVFDSAALNVRLGPGQFVLFAPTAAEAGQNEVNTIGDIMFYPEGSENTVNLCFIACSLVNHPL